MVTLRSLLDELVCISTVLGKSFSVINHLHEKIGSDFIKLRYQRQLFEELSEQEYRTALYAAGVIMKGLLSEHLLIKHPKNTQRIDREFLYSPTDRQDLPSYYRLLPKQRPDVLSYNAILQ